VDQIDEEDRRLFRRSMGDVKPLQCEHAVLPRKKPSPWRLRKDGRDGVTVSSDLPVSDQLELEVAEAGDVLRFTRSGVQPKWLLRLRRGELRVETELDLHGATVEATRHRLGVFLADAGARGLRCVRIIHGKGYRSTQTPVLKNVLNLWLRQIPHVLAFCSAPPGGGGTGAVLVLLKRSSV
jgi:DNA-nicking Smr family endonuclease